METGRLSVEGAVAAARLRQSKARARLELFFSGVLFGLMAVAARFASSGEGTFNAGQLSFLRFGIGVLFSLLLFRMRPGTFRPVNVRLLVTRGLLGGTAVVFYFFSLALIPAGPATLLNNTFPILATVFAVVALHERATAHLWAGLALTSAGVFLVLGGGELSLGLGWGELSGIASALLAAGAVTSVRRLRPTDNAPTIFFAFSLGGLVVSLPLAVGSPLPSDLTIWGAALACGLLSVAAQLLMTDSYGALTVPEAAVWQQLAPAASYLWALPLLGERVHGLGALGVALVLAGVVWGGVFGRATARPGHAATRSPGVTAPG